MLNFRTGLLVKLNEKIGIFTVYFVQFPPVVVFPAVVIFSSNVVMLLVSVAPAVVF